MGTISLLWAGIAWWFGKSDKTPEETAIEAAASVANAEQQARIERNKTIRVALRIVGGIVIGVLAWFAGKKIFKY